MDSSQIVTGSRISEQTFTVRNLRSIRRWLSSSNNEFQIVQFTFLALALIAVFAKIAVRLRYSSGLSVDDVILIVGAVLLSAAVGTFYSTLGLVFYVFAPESTATGAQYLQMTRLIDASAVLTWATIFSVKFSFVWFFRALTDRLPRMRIHWWIVCVIVIICAPINMFMTFYICNDFTPSLKQVCAAGIEDRVNVYINLTAALDIFTDLLVISIPITLLWRVRIDMTRKLALAAVLCLSAVMIALQVVRASLANVNVAILTGPPQAPHVIVITQMDQTWMFFWLNMEASIAIVMVAVTAFKSMLGRRSKSQPSVPRSSTYLQVSADTYPVDRLSRAGKKEALDRPSRPPTTGRVYVEKQTTESRNVELAEV